MGTLVRAAAELDPFKLKPVYEITPVRVEAFGLFRVISTGRIAVKAKFYKVIELDSGKIFFFSSWPLLRRCGAKGRDEKN